MDGPGKDKEMDKRPKSGDRLKEGDNDLRNRQTKRVGLKKPDNSQTDCQKKPKKRVTTRRTDRTHGRNADDVETTTQTTGKTWPYSGRSNGGGWTPNGRTRPNNDD